MKTLLSIILLIPMLIQGQDFWTETDPFPNDPLHWANSISIVSDNIVWISGTDYDPTGFFNFSKWAVSVDGGITWSDGNFPFAGELFVGNIVGISATTAYIVCSPWNHTVQGGVWVTFDAGVTWTQQQPTMYTGGDNFPDSVHFFDANNGVVIGDPAPGPPSGSYFEIYTTSNGGNNWTRIPSANIPAPLPDEYAVLGQLTSIGDTIWFYTYSFRLFKSSDKGLTWTVSQLPPNTENFFTDPPQINFAFKNENEGNIIVDSGLEFRTTDGGATWFDVTPGVTGNLYNRSLTYVPQTLGTYVCWGMDAGWNYGSSYSINNGDHWINLNSMTNEVLPYTARFYSPSVGYCSAYNSLINNGRGFFRLTDPLLRLLNTDSFEVGTDFSIYPNPTNGKMKISGEDICAITIYDISGKEVFSSVYKSLDLIEIDVSHFQNGIYLAKVSSQTGSSSTVKIVKS